MKQKIKSFLAGSFMTVMVLAVMISALLTGSVFASEIAEVAESAEVVEIAPLSVPAVSYLTVEPGSDETQLNFCWYSTTKEESWSSDE